MVKQNTSHTHKHTEMLMKRCEREKNSPFSDLLMLLLARRRQRHLGLTRAAPTLAAAPTASTLPPSPPPQQQPQPSRRSRRHAHLPRRRASRVRRRPRGPRCRPAAAHRPRSRPFRGRALSWPPLRHCLPFLRRHRSSHPRANPSPLG
jgi:hypothetical protein